MLAAHCARPALRKLHRLDRALRVVGRQRTADQVFKYSTEGQRKGASSDTAPLQALRVYRLAVESV